MYEYRLNTHYPQRGIIMGVSATDQLAQVFLPLAKYETGYIDSTVMLTEDMVGQEVIVVFISGDMNQGVITGLVERKFTTLKGALQDVSGTVSIPAIGFNGTVQAGITLTDQMVGNEVTIVYAQGDPAQGVIVGVKP